MAKTLSDINNNWEVLHADGTTIELNSYDNISCVTKAEQKCELNSADTVEMTVISASPLGFLLGDRVVVFGQTYKLNQLPQVKKTNSRKFEYTLTFEGVQYELIDRAWLLPDDTTRDSYTGDLSDFLGFLVDNANRDSEGVTWSIGECPDGTEYKTLTYTDKNCLEVLQALCEEYEVEYSITQTYDSRVINIKTKVGETLSYTFQYGRGKGAYSIERGNSDSSNVITKVYAYGSSENLGSKYRYTRLCLPDKEKNKSFVIDDDKVSVYGVREAYKTFDDIKPERTGTITAIKDGDPTTFYDSTMFELTKTDEKGNTVYLINGTTAKLTFQTGDLAGYEFEISSYIHKDRRFILKQFEDENGYAFPSSTFAPKVGDTYILSEISMPQEYIDDAESRLLEKANEQLAQTSVPAVNYTLDLDEAYLSEMGGEATVTIFHVGDGVRIVDYDLAIDATVRIQNFTRDIIKPYKFSLTLSDTTTASTLQRVVASLDRNTEAIEAQEKVNAVEARRRYQASEELRNMVFDTEGNYYSEKIAPLSIDTTMLAVGSRSQQFTLSGILFEPNCWNGTNTDPNLVNVTIKGAGALTHYTIDEDGVRTWSLNSVTFSDLESDKAYYIYAKCKREAGSTDAKIILDTTQRTVDSDTAAEYWYFLLGALSSVIDDLRVISLTYGSTTVNGKFINTGRITSTDGTTYFDLDTGEIRGNIEFNASEDNTVLINNIINANTKVVATEETANKAYSSSLSSSFYTRNFLRNSKPKSLSNFYQFPLTGRNFLRHTDFLNLKGDFRGCSSFVDSSQTSSTVSTNTYGFYCGYGGGIKFDMSDPEQCSPIIPTDSFAYTFSVGMRLRATGGTATITATFADGTTEETKCEPTTTAARFSATFYQIPLTIKVAAIGGYMAFSRAQLETGLVAREWAAAPEDASSDNSEFRNLILRGEASVELDYSSTTAYIELPLSPTAMNRPLKDEYMYLSYEQRGWAKTYYPVNRGVQFCDDKVESLTLVNKSTGTLDDFTRFVFRFKASSKYTANYLRLCCTSSGISHTDAVSICNVMLTYGNTKPTEFIAAPEDNDKQLEDNGVNVNTRSNLYTYPMNNQRGGYYTVAAYAGSSTHMAGYKVTHVAGQSLPNFMAYDNTTPTLSAKLTGICKVSIDIEVSTTALWDGMAIEIAPVDMTAVYAYGRLHLKHYKQTSTTRRTYYGYWNLKDGYSCYNTIRMSGLYIYYGSSFTDTSAWWLTVNNLELCQCKETPSAYSPATGTWDCTTGQQDAKALKATEYNTAAAYKRRTTEIYTFTGFTAGHNYEVTAASTDRITLPAGSYCYSYIVEADTRPKENGWRTYQTSSGQIGAATGKVIPYGVASNGTPRWLCFVTFTLSKEYADLRVPNIYFTPGQSDNVIYCARLESGTQPSLANYGLTYFGGDLADGCITIVDSEEPTIYLKDGGRVMLFTKDTDNVVSDLFPTGMAAYALSIYAARYDERASSEDGETKIGEVVVDYADKTSETFEVSTSEVAGNFTRPVFILTQTPTGITFAGDTSHTLMIKKLKLEVGTAASAWLESPEDTDSKYLRDALQEATESTTSLNGGLVLSKYIGVKDTAGVTVAGMSGTSQASAGALPMIWAGAAANTDTGMNSAKFRVFKSGHVDMSDVSISAGTSGAQGMTIENGNITLGTMGDDGDITAVKTQILSQTFATNATALASRKASTSSKSSTGYTFYPLAGTPVVTATIVTHAKTEPSGTGTVTITGANLIATLTGKASSAWRKGLTMITDSLTDDIIPEGTSSGKWISEAVGSLSAKVALYVTVNGKSMATIASASDTVSDTEQTVYTASTNTAYKGTYRKVSKTVTVNASFSTTKTATVSFNPGDVIGLKCEVSLTSSGNWGTLTKSCTTTAQAAYSSVGEAYNNVYYSNGLLLSSASNKYFAVNSSDTPLIQAQHTNALFKFTANGLLQSMNGSNIFYRVNPLVMAFSINYNSNSGYTLGSHYNPFGKTMGEINRDSAGKITVTHNYGDWTFTFATAIDATYSVFCKVVSFTSTSVTIGRIDRDGNYRDGNFQVMLFDFHKY